MFGFKRRRREKIRQQPFPQEWIDILNKNVSYYSLLKPEEQAELHGDILVFLAEKNIEGCAGLEITDEIRLTIAAEACMLLLNRDTKFYPSLKTILVYPHHYSTESMQSANGLVIGGVSTRAGESWHRGPVVLSWDDVRAGTADIHDGHNVVFHEFAHQLDDERGGTDGAPALEKRSMYVAWARVLGNEYTKLLDDIEHHRRNSIDSYGGTNPAEFFAVVTETFFEKPRVLQRKHPELYDQLKGFYHQDPIERFTTRR
ncbi:MAG: zinc-dependent peptidase [Phycisphaerae bacterium]|nr:zinc-dependent peptidase [Phycisphaerae bacterium]